MNDDERDILELFIESADELIDSAFLAKVIEGGITVGFNWSEDGLIQIDRHGPDNEAVKAFILTARFFCQNNERTSLDNMDTMIQNMTIHHDLKANFSELRQKLNHYLM